MLGKRANQPPNVQPKASGRFQFDIPFIRGFRQTANFNRDYNLTTMASKDEMTQVELLVLYTHP